MTKQTRTVLKGYFNVGDVPSESNFADLVDSGVYDDGASIPDDISAQCTANGNLLIDPSFEFGAYWSKSVDATTGIWTPSDHTSTKVRGISSVESFHGSQSLRMPRTGSTYSMFQSTAPASAAPGNTYCVSAYGKWTGTGFTDPQAALYIQACNNAGALIGSASSVTLPVTATDWTRVSVTLVAPANTDRLRVTITMGSSGTGGVAWWDLAEVRLGATAGTYTFTDRAQTVHGYAGHRIVGNMHPDRIILDSLTGSEPVLIIRGPTTTPNSYKSRVEFQDYQGVWRNRWGEDGHVWVNADVKFVTANASGNSALHIFHDTGSDRELLNLGSTGGIKLQCNDAGAVSRDIFEVLNNSNDLVFKILRGLQVTGDLGFYGTAPIAQQTGVAVTAAGIHAALVALGLITA